MFKNIELSVYLRGLRLQAVTPARPIAGRKAPRPCVAGDRSLTAVTATDPLGRRAANVCSSTSRTSDPSHEVSLEVLRLSDEVLFLATGHYRARRAEWFAERARPASVRSSIGGHQLPHEAIGALGLRAWFAHAVSDLFASTLSILFAEGCTSWCLMMRPVQTPADGWTGTSIFRSR